MPGQSSNNQVGIGRDQFAGVIALADDRGTPMLDLLPKPKALGSPKAMYFDWQLKQYVAPTSKPKDLTTDVNTFQAKKRRVQARGYLQGFREEASVDTLAEDVNEPAGLSAGEMADEISAALVIFLRDQEATICSSREGATKSGSQDWATRGIFVWADASLQSSSDALAYVPADYRAPSTCIYTGAFASLTETSFTDMLAAQFQVNGRMTNYEFHCGTDLKKLISSWQIYTPTVANFTALRWFNGDTGRDKITLRACVGAIEGDFGSINLTPNTWLNNNKIEDVVAGGETLSKRSGIGFLPEQTHWVTKIPPSFKFLENRGGGPRGYMQCTGGLGVEDPSRLMSIMPGS